MSMGSCVGTRLALAIVQFVNWSVPLKMALFLYFSRSAEAMNVIAIKLRPILAQNGVGCLQIPAVGSVSATRAGVDGTDTTKSTEV